MKVEHIISERSGEGVRNQFVIHHDGKIYFQSYNSLIAEWDGDNLTLGYHFDYSVTTSKYLHIFIKEYCYKIERILNNYSGSYCQKLRKAINDDYITYDGGMW